MPLAMVCEAPADHEIGATLADRVLLSELRWLDGLVAEARCWRGEAATERAVYWREVTERARQRGLRIHGHFRGEPGAPDAAAARRVLRLLEMLEERPAAVVLLRDSDGDADRLRGLEQARDARAWPFAVIIGLAHAKRECWVLAGFTATDEQEKEALAGLRRELGFDPVTHSEQLDAQDEHAKRSAKRVLALLSSGNRDREARCWTATPLETLRQQGKRNGLASYLDALQALLVPLFTNPPPGN